VIIKMFRIFLVVILGLGVASCTQRVPSERARELQEWMRDNGKKKILCTTAQIKDLVKGVGGDVVDVIALIEGEHDPHSYQLVKGDDEKFLRADCIFSNGLGLEHGSSLARKLRANPHAYALGDAILRHNPSHILFLGKTPDPHIWMDMELFAESVPFIVEVLGTICPSHKDLMKKNGKKLQEELEKNHHYIQNLLHQIPAQRRYLVTTHDAFGYFARAYLSQKSELENGSWEDRVEAPEGLAPSGELSTADISRIVDHILAHKIDVIFPEMNLSRDSLKKLIACVEKKGGHLRIAKKPLFGDSIGKEYIASMRYNGETIREEIMK
jgi:manganese/zinc/iron transport system substrate-binding protein